MLFTAMIPVTTISLEFFFFSSVGLHGNIFQKKSLQHGLATVAR